MGIREARVRVAVTATVLGLGAALVAPAGGASADSRTVNDRRGDYRKLDLTSATLKNGRERLVGSMRVTKRSMKPNAAVTVGLRYRKPGVGFLMTMAWKPKWDKPRVKIDYIPEPFVFVDITKRCDVTKSRKRNRFRIGVDQARCFRRHAGRARFAALTIPDGTLGEGDEAPDGRLSKAVPRG